jgi:hypothetical protein
MFLFLAACPSKPATQPEPVASASANLVPTPPTPLTAMANVIAPKALVSKGHAVDWWFAFKFNSATYTSCTGTKACPFGGTPQPYPHGQDEQFAYASSESPELAMSTTCIGATDDDPVGATFAQIYNGAAFYVLWNDQFYDDPKIAGCDKSCSAPWAHSKGMVAWGSNGEGVAMQVTTPSWPASGSASHPRTDGNTLGCVSDDNVMVSQHFFAVKLTHEDLVKLLHALKNASIVTDTKNPQIVHDGGPADVSAIVQTLGKNDASTSFTKETLTTGVVLVSKPHALHVPPWQMVSAIFGGVALRTATWWEDTPSRMPIPSTNASTPIGCWDASLGHAGAVKIATTGTWDNKTIGLKGGLGQDFNHAKLAVSTDASSKMIFFGDMNQEGSLTDKCTASQNGRGGLFYAVSDAKLHASVTALLKGSTAPN